MSILDDITDLKRRLAQMEQYLSRIPMRPVPTPAGPLVVQIVNGQLVNSVPCVQYVSAGQLYQGSEQSDQLYNPLTATSYIAGLGNGMLYGYGGQPSGLVLVRHNWPGFTDTIIANARFLVNPIPTQIPVQGSSPVAYLSAYQIIGE